MKYVLCCAVLLVLLQVTLCEGEESETRISVRQLGSLSGLLSTILALLTNLLGGGPVTAGVSVGVGGPATTTGLLGGLLGGGGTSTTTGGSGGGGGLLGGLLNGLLGGLLGGGGGNGGGLLGGLLGK